ncbi:MAG: hypothetical protein HQ575_00190 [Candidatus Omnitrophica bacterium]|nr:hypothetical protein [Candidatus Omnitrophota bacterium]
MKIRLALLVTIILIIAGLFLQNLSKEPESIEILNKTWEGYKYFFITDDGRVKRPKDGDTVSEGQAYAMLRAVWMDDKETFDRCYAWTEDNLSRKNNKGDNLLAWLWKDAKVQDWMPASDADIDYALSLVFADSIWKEGPPDYLEGYGVKAEKILKDILDLETFKIADGRLFLSPWILEKDADRILFPVNPSYYSPAHFRVFHQFTNDPRWIKLADTTYFILRELSREFDGQEGLGLIPDWCSIDNAGVFHRLDDKSGDFGWESVRIPFRVMLDYLWFQDKNAKTFFESSGYSQFLKREWRKRKAIYCEYAYTGKPLKAYENPLFYSAYYCVLSAAGSPYADNMLKKTRSYIEKYKGGWLYIDKDEYYVNSLAWLADGIKIGIIKNIYGDN